MSVVAEAHGRRVSRTQLRALRVSNNSVQKISRSHCNLLLAIAAFLLPFLLSQEAHAAALRISLAQDIALGTWNGSGNTSGMSDVCIYHDADTNYAVKATMSGGSYILSSSGNDIAVEVSFKNSSGGGGAYTALPYNTTRSFSGADQSSISCSGGFNANVKVVVTEAEISQAVPGTYTGTLTLTLTAS